MIAPLPDDAGVDGPHQPSLLALLSLRDLRRFVPETLGLLLIIMLARTTVEVSLPGAFGPHLAFWIPVLLMAAQYGIMGGLFAAMATSILVLATEWPALSAAQDFYEYAASAAAQPLAWFIVALVLGGLRTLHMHHHGRLVEQLHDTRSTAEALAHQLAEVATELALLELRIATDSATAAVLTDALARIDLRSRHALLASFAALVHHGAGAESFAVFLREGEAWVPRYGSADGLSMSPDALALLPPANMDGDEPWRPAVPGRAGEAMGMPVRLPIQGAGGTGLLGWLVCTRITPTLTPATVTRRLDNLCRLLAALLPIASVATHGTAVSPVDVRGRLHTLADVE